MRWLDTLWVATAMVIFTLVFLMATAWSLRLDPADQFDNPVEAILIYPPWQSRDAMLASLQATSSTLVSSNTTDTAWLVRVANHQALQSLLDETAWMAFKPTQLAIVVAGCGAVAIDPKASSRHQSS